MKTCTVCKITNECTQFSKNKRSADGYYHQCKSCTKIYKDKIKDKTAIQNKQWNFNNKEKISSYNKEYRKNNPDKIQPYKYENHLKWYSKNRLVKLEYSKNYSAIPENKEKHKQYNKINKEKINNQYNHKYKTKPQYKLGLLLRNRIKSVIKKQNINKSNTTLNLLGCSLEEFKLHTQSQFFPEMNWENHGRIWEIDHIKPCASFDLTDVEQQKQCFHYINLRPLFKTTEIAKSFNYNQTGNRNRTKNYGKYNAY